MNENIYPWRGAIGLIYPSSSNTMEPEFYAMAPKGVATCTTRVHLGEVSVKGLAEMDEEIAYGAKLLSESYVNAILLGCTSGSFIKGEAYNQEIIRKMERASGGIRCTTTTSSIMAALHALKIRKIAVATPYIDEINERARRYFEDSDINVCNLKGLGLSVDKEITERSSEENFKLAKAADTADADAVVILCTSLRTVTILDALEKDLKKPVISAIQASYWHVSHLAGINEPIEGFGKLLQISDV